MVKFPNKPAPTNKGYLLIDQGFPVGSKVQVKKENGKTYLTKVNEKELRIIDEKELINPEGVWITKEPEWMKNEGGEVGEAVIVGWEEREGVPVALLSSFEHPHINKKVGDELKVKIRRVFRDPIGEGGWIEAEVVEPDIEGFRVPIELSDMSLHPKGYGLEIIEGKVLSLPIDDFDEDGTPKLSNVKRIVSDLKSLRNKLLMEDALLTMKMINNTVDSMLNTTHEILTRLNKERGRLMSLGED